MSVICPFMVCQENPEPDCVRDKCMVYNPETGNCSIKDISLGLRKK